MSELPNLERIIVPAYTQDLCRRLTTMSALSHTLSPRQTSTPSTPRTRVNSRVKQHPCNGATGKRYTPHTAEVLAEAADARGFTSPYWLTRNQFQLFAPPIELKSGAGEGVTLQAAVHDTGGSRMCTTTLVKRRTPKP